MESVKCFSKETITQANNLAMKRNYNRQLEPNFISELPDDKLFPVVMTIMHDHANGVKVDPHVRCWIYFNNETNAFVDCDMDLYMSLQEVAVPEKKESD